MYGIDMGLNGSDCSLEGIKIAKVISNGDPKAQERVYIRVVGVHNMDSTDPDYGIWAHHLAPSKSNSGEIPDVGDYIYVVFPDKADPNNVLWLGWCRWSS
jgi:hypothetical protein